MLISGVPEITPFVKFNPGGRVGTMVQLLTTPVYVGTRSTIGSSRVNVKFSGEYERDTRSSTMVMLMYAVAVPPVLVAVMVNMLRVSNSVGVPLSTPVEASKERPLGSDGLMAHETNSPEPVMAGESGRSLLAVLLVKSKSFGE